MTKVAPILLFLPSFVICSQPHLISAKDDRIHTRNNNNNDLKQTNKKMDHVYTHQLHFENSSLNSANVYGI